MSDPGWDPLRARIESDLGSLEERGFLVISEPDPFQPATTKGRFRRRPKKPAAVRFVQFMRVEGALLAECVGAACFGGPDDLVAAEDVRLREHGWEEPQHDNLGRWGAPSYRISAALDDHARFARLGVEALDVIGLTPQDELSYIRGR